MPNALELNKVYTKETQQVVYESSALLPNITIQNVSNIGSGDNPYINLRLPNKATVRKNSMTFSAQDIKDESIPLILTKTYGADFVVTDSEDSLSIEDKINRFINPGVRKIISEIEQDMYTDTIANAGSFVTGAQATAGLDTMFKARTALDFRGAFDKRTFIADPNGMEGILKQGRGLFQDASEIAKQYTMGIAGRIAGFDIYDSYRIPRALVGTGVDGSFAVTMTEGSATIAIATLAAGAIKKGQPFTIAGCNEVNEEGIDLGTLKVFRAVADSTSGSVTVNGKIYASAPLKNVSALISTSVAVDFQGTASAGQFVAFDKSAIIAGFVPLRVPKGEDEAGIITMDGVKIRYVYGFDKSAGTWIYRLDAQLGWVFRPEIICAGQYT